jgi:hypothetical protein
MTAIRIVTGWPDKAGLPRRRKAWYLLTMSSFEICLLIALGVQAFGTIWVAVGVGEIRKDIEAIWRRMPPQPPVDYK